MPYAGAERALMHPLALFGVVLLKEPCYVF